MNCDNKNSVHIIPRCIIQITYFRKKCTALMRGKYQLYLMLAVRACAAVGYRNSSSPRSHSLSKCYLNDALYQRKMFNNIQKRQNSVTKVQGINIIQNFLTKSYLTDVTATHNVEAHYSKQFLVFVRNWRCNRIGSRVKKFRACRRPASK